MWAYRRIFSRFSLISQAREVKLRHFKSLKPSTWYGQCRKAIKKCSSLFLSAQLAKMGAYCHIFSHSSLISQAREVELRHFKRLKSSTWYGQSREAIEKCSRLFLTAQWAEMGANRQIFSHFSLISQARKVKLRHSKSLKSSTWYGQCRKAMEKCSSLISTAQWAKNVSQLEHTWGQNDSNFRLCGLGTNWFVRAGNFLGRSYCLHNANMLMYPLTADVPINCCCSH